VIEIAVDLPLAAGALRVEARLGDGITAVMGPSGAGKTSLLEALAGLRRRARGRIAVGDAVLLDSARGVRLPPERRRVGYVPQDAGLFPHLTARQNLRFGARGDRHAVESAIDTLELRPLLDRYPVSLSGGEKQRVALGRALAAAPRLLLLDEPLAALDVGLRERVLPYLMRIRDAWAVPCLYVTHNAGEALALAAEVLLLRDGRIEAAGAPLDVLGAARIDPRAEPGLENLLAGRVAAHDERGGVTRVDLAGGLTLAVPLAAARAVGETLTLAVRAEDVLVANVRPTGLSARNVFEARVEAVDRAGADVLLRCAVGSGGRPWLVRLTPSAVDGLGLARGVAVWLAVKSHSVRVA
jgi:molybdate transport system ATP-binding protein